MCSNTRSDVSVQSVRERERERKRGRERDGERGREKESERERERERGRERERERERECMSSRYLLCYVHKCVIYDRLYITHKSVMFLLSAWHGFQCSC
jgi:hypothetical protein